MITVLSSSPGLPPDCLDFTTSVARFTSVKAFPQNLEISVQMPLFSDGTFMTLHYSISSLPAVSDYTPRQADDRIDLSPEQGVERRCRIEWLVNRWLRR